MLVAFLRLSTKAGLFSSPLRQDEALEQVRLWLQSPGARIINPTEAHLDVLTRVLMHAATASDLNKAAHIAALAVEHRAFPEVRWRRPDHFPHRRDPYLPPGQGIQDRGNFYVGADCGTAQHHEIGADAARLSCGFVGR